MHVVIDKSYVQGSSRDEIHNLCCEYRLVMPEVLFMEILTTKEENISKCFKKFPQTENPVELIPDVGSLLRFEIENKRPCTPIENHFLKFPFVFNPRLAENKFIFTKEHKDSLKEWEALTEQDSIGFAEKAIVADGWFPELSEYIPGSSIDVIHQAISKVVNDTNFLKSIYNSLRDTIHQTYGATLPEADQITESWILCRYLQTHLLAAIEYIRKYGKNFSGTVTKRLKNERLDVDYCIIAALADGLASRDKTMGNFFKLLCPEKIFLS